MSEVEQIERNAPEGEPRPEMSLDQRCKLAALATADVEERYKAILASMGGASNAFGLTKEEVEVLLYKIEQFSTAAFELGYAESAWDNSSDALSEVQDGGYRKAEAELYALFPAFAAPQVRSES